MDNDQTWYRQLLALVLLSASRAAVEFLTNPSSKEDAQKQLRGALESIDFDMVAKAITRGIDNVASTSKDRLSTSIDTLRDRSVDVVDVARNRAEKQLAPRKSGHRAQFVIGLLFGALVAYFLLDEQRRDDLLDRLTGASGPIQQSSSQSGQGGTDTPTSGPAST